MAGIIARQGKIERALQLWQQSLERKEGINDVQGKAASCFGVTRLGSFGSVARDEATDQSDLDIVIEMDLDLFGMMSLKAH